MENNKLFIGNLNFNTTKEDIEALCRELGTVVSVRMRKNSGHAFVEMATAEEAHVVIQVLDKKKYMDRELRAALELSTRKAKSKTIAAHKERKKEENIYRTPASRGDDLKRERKQPGAIKTFRKTAGTAGGKPTFKKSRDRGYEHYNKGELKDDRKGFSEERSRDTRKSFNPPGFRDDRKTYGRNSHDNRKPFGRNRQDDKNKHFTPSGFGGSRKSYSQNSQDSQKGYGRERSRDNRKPFKPDGSPDYRKTQQSFHEDQERKPFRKPAGKKPFGNHSGKKQFGKGPDFKKPGQDRTGPAKTRKKRKPTK
ncbi:MAG: RNA-binding protein [Spirochaetales bacterium]|nr:RNA-binding protein [Spirochaetales bacterium]